MHGGWVYIMSNRPGGVLYVGVTADIARRAWQHRTGRGATFTDLYRLHRLVFVEAHETILTAIQREKNLKHWPRAWKVALIERDNPAWCDLFDRINA